MCQFSVNYNRKNVQGQYGAYGRCCMRDMTTVGSVVGRQRLFIEYYMT